MLGEWLLINALQRRALHPTYARLLIMPLTYCSEDTVVSIDISSNGCGTSQVETRNEQPEEESRKKDVALQCKYRRAVGIL